MLRFTDYDERVFERRHVETKTKLPEKIESIEVYYDGGRLALMVNGQEFFYADEGTRDCCVRLDNT